MKYQKVFSLWLLFSSLSVSVASAADFNTLPATGTFGVKKEVITNIKIDTAGETINAAQAKLKFNPTILEVKSIVKDSSIFNFWLQEPKFSNADGTIEFIGGTTNGVSGSALQVVQITFVTRGVGSSNLDFVDASIAAADGSGTNILSNANGAKFLVSSNATTPVSIPPPTQITRTPTVATGLPALPNVSVALYPNQANWYNFVAQFTPSWKLPSDISGLNTALNTNPNFTVPQTSEGLFEGKTFPAISKDGIYYFHIRFQNRLGWGPTAHYRIAVDTQPPVGFKIDVPTGLADDNPSPKLVFNTADALSGLNHYDVTINSEEPIVINSSGYTLLPHPPGEYTIKVRAHDNAGNSSEDRVKLEILPIETPIITSITKKIIIGSENPLDIKGTAIIGSDVLVTIEDKNKFLVLEDEIKTNPLGEWEFRFDKELRGGNYFVTIKAKDSRGALSLPTDRIKISFVDKPVISLFGLNITLKWLLVLLVIAGVLVVLWFYRKALLRLARSQRESIIINRDIKNAFEIVKADLDKISSLVKKNSLGSAKEVELAVLTKKIKDSLDKIAQYSSRDIEKLR